MPQAARFETPWWKGVKFWIVLLLAAVVATLLLRLVAPVDDAGTASAWLWRPFEVSDARAEEPAPDPPAKQDRAGSTPAAWRARIVASRARLQVALTALGVPDGEKLGTWVTLGMLPELGTLWRAAKLSEEQAACLAKLEWTLDTLADRVAASAAKPLSDAELHRALDRQPPRTLPDVVHWVAVLRTRDTDGARWLLDRVLRDWIEGDGEHDKVARAHLGYVEFHHPVPDAIAFRRHAFLRVVEQANAKRWYAKDEAGELALAQSALLRMQAHHKLLVSSHRRRAFESLKANLYEESQLDGLYLRTHETESYLLGFVSKHDLGPDTKVGFGPTDRSGGDASARRRYADALLRARGALYQAVHDEFRRWLDKPLKLRPFTDPFGGHPYPLGIRSFADGRPMIVLLLDEGVDYLDFPSGIAHLIRVQGLRGRVVARESRRTDDAKRAADAVAHAQMAVQQLWHWTVRQANNWGHPPQGPPLVAHMLAARLTCLKTLPDGTLGFGTRPPGLIEDLRALAKQRGADAASGASRWMPISEFLAVSRPTEPKPEDLGSLEDWRRAFEEIRRTFEERLRTYDRLRSTALLQATALGLFFLHSDDDELEAGFLRILKSVQQGEGGRGLPRAFQRAFQLILEDQRTEFDQRYFEFLDGLIQEDPAPHRFVPPPVKPGK